MKQKLFSRKPPFSQSPLINLTGHWINKSGSPPARIYKRSHSFYIEFTYKDGTKVERPIKALYDKMVFNLFGRIELAYDEERERLLIASEGIYQRDNQE